MSFSGDVKRELLEHVGSARHCLIAELSALICACGRVSLEPPMLEIHTENEVPYKKALTLLQKAFNLKSLEEQHVEGGGWSLRITLAPEIYTVLSACGLVQRTADGWMLETAPEERITERSCCRRAYIRGAFLGSGSINDPNKNYHLEFVLEQKAKAEKVQRLLGEFGVEAHVLIRRRFSKDIYVTYLKDGSQIADVLNIMGSHASLLRFEDIRVVKDVRNQINRQVNCEAANLDRIVSAAVRQTEDIRLIEERLGLDTLPKGLREVAEARLAAPDASLMDISVQLGIGKSGVNHRFRKLLEIADSLRQSKS
ncbi:MAG: DNA-binding protein WhiA [Clostridiales bacterium]|nr:DNA-binding protein WhiA [Clostridiales bacterium]